METILIGIITKPQGIKGELRVQTLTDTPQIFASVKNVIIDGEARKILSCRVADGVYICLNGIADRNAAELMRNKEIFALKGDLQIDEQRWFVEDILGCRVELDNQKFIGNVVDVITRGGTDVFTVEKEGKRCSFPFLKDMIVSVDVSQKSIVLFAYRFKEVVLYED